MRRFFVIIDVLDDEWIDENEVFGIESSLATWIDGAMSPDVDSAVYSNMEDFLSDHALDALARTPDE